MLLSSEKSRNVNFSLGERLRVFTEQYGGVNKLAKALGISQPRLSNYLGGTRDMPTKLIMKLSDLGCDANWLMTGMTAEETNKAWEKMKEGFLPPDDRAMLNKLHELNILTLRELKEALNWEKLYEKKPEQGLKMVAEPPSPKYNANKKRGEKK